MVSFKEILNSEKTSFLMEAHDGISAKIVDNEKFDGIWASGLSISTAMGFRDSNEASWSQMIEIVERMVNVSSIPILFDGDTGYGNFNNVRILVKKLAQIGVSAVCLEDKLFPKTNSFIGEKQPLAEVGEFCGKIKAAKDSQGDAEFSIIARVEALIAGHGMSEALRRAEAYFDAGADGILIHSKKRNASEVMEFIDRWAKRSPTVIVPTKYALTPTSMFEKAGVNIVIWANHNLRASIYQMERVVKRIKARKNIHCVETDICDLEHVFSLMNYEELEASEKKYLSTVRTENRQVL